MANKYRQSRHEFYHSGVDIQKTPDLYLNIKRVCKEEMQAWTDDEKKNALSWICRIESVFYAYKSEIIEGIKTQQP